MSDFENGESFLQKQFQGVLAKMLKEKNGDNKVYCSICGDLEDLRQLAEPDNRYLCNGCIVYQTNIFNTELKFKDKEKNELTKKQLRNKLKKNKKK